MIATDPFVTLVLTLLLFTSFVKFITTLTVFRYGVGLTGFEFGIACLLVSFTLAVVAAPPELAEIGFPEAIFSEQKRVQPQEVTNALLPFMSQRIDPSVARAFNKVRSVERDATDDSKSLRVIAPAFMLSELKSALTIGCMLLVPFIVIDLIVAHLMALVGIGHLTAGVVSLPLKLILFLAVDGWTLLAEKLLGV